MNLLTRIHRLASTVLVVMCAAALVLNTSARGDVGASIVVVTSRDDGPYEGVVKGIRGLLTGDEKGLGLRVHSLQSDSEEAREAIRAARSGGTAPILTVGSMATRAALDAPGDAPVIACMVVDADDLREARNATGVLLEFPLETQLEWIRRFSPKSQSIGVLYNPAENREKIKKAKRIAKRLGLRIVAREVHRPQDLPDALDSLAREADLLWAVTDQMVLSRQTAQAILLFSFRHRMPFTGLSSSWVKAGALYALDRDYEDMGAQCGEMAIQVLNGRKASSLPPAIPRKVVYALNLRTAEHLKLNLPQHLIEGAAEVFR